ncbi:MAG: phosphate ABC transporter substrate-binding/OmpA family protein [Pseudomonadota bacterium]
MLVHRWFEARMPAASNSLKVGVLAAASFALTMGSSTLPSIAQSDNKVTLEAIDGSTRIRGELIEYNEDVYIIKSNLGTLTVAFDSVECTGAACPDLSPDPALTRQVILTAVSDGTVIMGELVDYSSDHYTIRTALGEFRISNRLVDCVGDVCPEIEVYDPNFSIRIADRSTSNMMQTLLRGFARSQQQLYQAASSEGRTDVVRINDQESGELIANINFVHGADDGPGGAFEDSKTEALILNRELSADAQQDFSSFGSLNATLLGQSGLVFIANDDNPVRDLSVEELAAIWSGDLRSWRSLGAGDFPITLHLAEDRVIRDADSLVKLANFIDNQPDEIVVHATDEDVIAAVQSERHVIGLVERVSAVNSKSKMLSIRNVCGLVSSPSNFDVKVGRYPLASPIYAYTKSKGGHPFIEAFIEWAQTDEAQQLVAQAGFASRTLQRMKIQDMGAAVIHTAAVEPDFDGAEFASMMRELRYADRLSITFRFLQGSSRLDAESVANVQELAKRLRNREFEGQEVLVVGFADSVGPAPRNTILAAQRADTVRELLAAQFSPETLLQVPLTSLSFGEQMPVDCNNTDDGRANNRRVEIWVRLQSES